MNSRVHRGIFAAGIAVTASLLVFFAYSRPGYFTSSTYLEGLLLLEFLVAAVWLYRRVFFPVVIVTFLLAGMDLPLGSVWTMARWLVLGLGAMVGTVIMLKERRYAFGMFHVLAVFAFLAALTSAAVSRYSSVSLLKALSLFLLFLFAATGARLAATGRENRFLSGLLLGSEVFVAAIAALYLAGREAMGNPNSLGAVMGVVAAPVLLWGTLLKQEPFAHKRRLLLYGIAMYLTLSSHARAAIAAAFVSCALLCLALRQYRLLAQGVGIMAILVATMAIVQPDAFSRTVTSVSSNVLYKGKDPQEGLLASRKTPWQDTLDTIQNHFWFGTGFGTSDTGQDATQSLGTFASSSAASAEHGSSYLAIVSWVGILGVLPFFALVLWLLKLTVETIYWMVRTGNPAHPAVPLAMVMVAGMIHAGLEDWLFAPGYYLCVFYWSMAFVLWDQVRSLSTANAQGNFRRANAGPRELRAVGSMQ